MLESAILTELFLKEHHRALMPLVIAEEAKRRLKGRQMEMKPSKNAVQQLQKVHINEVKETGTKIVMSSEEALEILLKEEPTDDVDKTIKNYFLKQLEHTITQKNQEIRISTSESHEHFFERKMSDFEQQKLIQISSIPTVKEE